MEKLSRVKKYEEYRNTMANGSADDLNTPELKKYQEQLHDLDSTNFQAQPTIAVNQQVKVVKPVETVVLPVEEPVIEQATEPVIEPVIDQIVEAVKEAVPEAKVEEVAEEVKEEIPTVEQAAKIEQDNLDSILNSFLKEVDDYNRKNGRLTTDDAKDTILNDIRSSGVDASGIDTTLLVEDNKVTSLSEELEKIDAVTQEIHESLTRNVEQRSFDDVRFVEQVDEPVTEKEAEPVIEEPVVEPVVEPVEEATVVEEPEPVKVAEETVAEPVKEEVLATPAPEAIEEDTIRLSFDTATAPVEESPVETETKPQEAETTIMLDPMKMKAVDNKPSAEDFIEETASQQINNTILTIQSMVQNQEEEKEEEDDEVDEYRPNKILNMILIVLIIALIGVLGVIGYWILLARGII